MKRLNLLILFALISRLSFGQNLEDLDNYSVDQFYKKQQLDSGTLDEDGNATEHAFRGDLQQLLESIAQHSYLWV